jgi:hypothetical protein
MTRRTQPRRVSFWLRSRALNMKEVASVAALLPFAQITAQPAVRFGVVHGVGLVAIDTA